MVQRIGGWLSVTASWRIPTLSMGPEQGYGQRPDERRIRVSERDGSHARLATSRLKYPCSYAYSCQGEEAAKRA